MRSLSLVALFVGLASLIGYLFKIFHISETNIVVVYLLFVLLSARFTKGYIYGIFSAIISTAAYNYLFTSPYFTFHVDDFGYVITFVIMTMTALITSALTSRVKQNALESQQREMGMRALYQLTSHLSEALDVHDIASITVQMLYELLSCRIGFLCFDEHGIPESSFIQQVSSKKQVHREIEDVCEIQARLERIKGEYYCSEEFFNYPIYGREEILGLLRVEKEVCERFTPLQRKWLHTVIDSIGMSMDRLRVEHKRLQSREAFIQERYRANLLRSISHDLRTPLSGIMGMAEMLMDMGNNQAEIYNLSCDIYSYADWLKSLVENILSLTQWQEGQLCLNKEYESVEELIESAVRYIRKREVSHALVVDVSEALIMVNVDAKLIVQVLTNLIDNAIKHAKQGTEIVVKAEYIETDEVVDISVIDSGEGFLEEDLPKVFQMFYTSNSSITDGAKGIGLGLSICEAIIQAHGGTIEAKNRKNTSGAIVTVRLSAKVHTYES